MTGTVDIHEDIDRLRGRLSGRVLGPGDRGWDSARQAWNLAVDQHPAAVVLATGVDDVATTLRFARERRLGVAAQGTGHGASTLDRLDDVVLLKTVRMAGVEVDPARSLARAQAGAVWGDVAVAAAAHGLFPLAGSSADVGVVGYTLGGGIGWLARRHGIACNSVHAIEIVTADGALRRVDADREPELFWALRGGGGAFGVVTAIELGLHPVSDVFAGMIVWPAERAGEAISRYLECTRDAPDELSASLRLLHLPPVPDVPEPLRGRHVVAIDAVHLGREADGAELLRSLRSLDGAILDTFAAVGACDLLSLHGDPQQPHPGIGEGLLLAAMPDEAAARFLELGGPESGSPLVSLELRHLGGALARSAPGHGALDRLRGEYAVYGVGSPLAPGSAAAIEAHLDLVAERLKPWAGERPYLNFADRRGSADRAFDADVLARLRRVKTDYDPDDVVRSNHPIETLDETHRS